MDSKENGIVNNDTGEKKTGDTAPVDNTENQPGDDKAKIAEFETKLAELNDKYIRLYSEFENFKKRTLRERLELVKSAGEDVFKLILPVLDDFERAMRANENAAEVKTVNEGISLVYHKMKNSLASRGLEEMNAAGEDFNPDLHEAVTNIPAPSGELKGKVIEVVEKGYTLNGKVIRYAKVIVGS